MTVALAVLLPLVAAVLVPFGGRVGALGRRVAAFAPLALLLPLMSGERGEWRWVLLGIELAVDPWGVPFVLLTAIAWSASGYFALHGLGRGSWGFWLGWSLSLWGMVLVLLAQNLVTFYLGYVAVSLSAYLMITHARTGAAWRAGRIYLLLAFAGEAAIVSGVLVLAGHYGNVSLPLLATPDFAAGVAAARWPLFVGFAVKLGIVPLHVWLPLAHPIAPVPASAILSGVIVKAGLLGWLKLIPPQGLEAAASAPALLWLGLATAFVGVLLGLTQGKLKTVLAYSTISQMGLVLVAYAAYSLQPGDARWLAAIGLLALHHGLTKTSLFLAAGCAPGASGVRRLLLALPALSLAAAPFATGYLAKGWLGRAVAAGIDAGALASISYTLLTFTSAATALLMWRLWLLALRERDAEAALHPAWALSALAALTVPWLYAGASDLLIIPTVPSVWAATWPILVAGAIVLLARVPRRPGLTLPEGDLVVVLEKLASRIAPPQLPAVPSVPAGARLLSTLGRSLAGAESLLRELPMVGLLMLLISVVVWLLLWL